MSEETEEIQTETPSPEAADDSSSQKAEGQTASKKSRKINKLSLSELEKKIEELEKANHIKSKHYQHLFLRKKELKPE